MKATNPEPTHSRMNRWLVERKGDPMADAIRRELQRLRDIVRGCRCSGR